MLKATEKTVAIIGTGLIGASIGLALKRQIPRCSIIGWDRRAVNLRSALRRGAVDRHARSLEEAVSGAACVVIATPLEHVITNVALIIEVAASNAFIIDVAGLKAPVLRAAKSSLRKRPDILFAGGHPLAGSELAGPSNASRDLFKNRPFVVCLAGRNRHAAAVRRRAEQFAASLGAYAVVMQAAEHDTLVAAISALPQLVSACTALAVRELKFTGKLAGPGYEGVTRLAASPFAPWKAPLALNARNVRKALAVFEVQVRKMRLALEENDTRVLQLLFKAAALARRTSGSR